MTVVGEREPTGGREIVHAELARRCDGSTGARSLCGTVQTGAPLPAYVLSFEDASGPKPLARARLFGWRYPVIGDEAVGLALLRKTADGPAYGGLTEGRFVDRLLNTAVLAEKFFSEHGVSFRARLLEIPSLHICVMWLCGPRGKSYFATIVDNEAASSLQIDDDIEARIRAALEMQARHADAADAGRARPLLTCDIRLPASDAYGPERRVEVETILAQTIERVSQARRIEPPGADAGTPEAPRRHIVVLDASSGNAAALVDMGKCMAVGQPAILVIDDESARALDLGDITHVVYPRDLRYSTVVAFQERLFLKLLDLLDTLSPVAICHGGSVS